MKLRFNTTSKIVWISAIAIMAMLAGCGDKKSKSKAENSAKVMRLGYFPNITHAQALLGVKRGDFAKALGPDIQLKTSTFNAGPSVIEAVFAGHLDIAYVGPSPILNGFLQSKGKEIRVIAGSGTNGVLVIGNKKRGITSMEQLRGKRIATPQLGNTQDMSAKDYVVTTLKAKLKSGGGDTDVIPVSNPDIETLFAKDQLDAAWVPEPWGSRIIARDLAVLIEEEKNLWPDKTFALTNVIARKNFLKENPGIVKKFLEAHVKLTRELQANPQSYAADLNAELKRLTSKELPPDVIAGALRYTGFDTDPNVGSFQRFFEMGQNLGLLKGDSLDTGKLIKTELLEEVLGEASATAPAPNAGDVGTTNTATESTSTRIAPQSAS